METLSIVIVAYKNMDCLADCLASIPQLPWIEVVVVNNTHQNRGFATGCNFGLAQTHGKYVLFLNPDCIVSEKALRALLMTLQKDKTIGVLGPLLTDRSGQPYLSCNKPASRLLSPWVYSIFNTWMSRVSSISEYWFNHQAPNVPTEVGSCCGAALAMRREVVNTVRGFDEKFFLYWEEFDLEKRVADAGYRVVFDPRIQIVHVGELSTLEPKSQIMKWFKASRYYFFKKHFGFLYAALLEGWFTLWEEWRLMVALAVIIILSLWVYIEKWWVVYGDIGSWFAFSLSNYLSATLGYWLSIAGIVMIMAAVYNDVPVVRRSIAALIALCAGIVLFLSVPSGFVILFPVGLVWIFLDGYLKNERLRKRILVFLMCLSMTWVFSFSKIHRLIPLQIPLSDWIHLSTFMQQNHMRTISLRCVGCDREDQLYSLTLLLHDSNIDIQDGYPVHYITVPPFSSYSGRIPDTQTYRFGSVLLSIPLSRP